MEDVSRIVGYLVLLVATVFFAAVMGGTILWGCYDSLQVMFPSAVSSGILAPELGWWDAVKISWIATVLIKATSAAGSSKKSE